MPSADLSRIPIPRHLIAALACALLVLTLAASTGIAQEAADPGGPSSGSTVTASPAVPSTPATTDGGDAPGEDDVVLVLGYTAATVLGLTALALLDRKPDPVDRDIDEE